MKQTQTVTPPPVRRLRKAAPYPDVSKVAERNDRYSEKDQYLLVPYNKAPKHWAYKKVRLAPAQTMYVVNRKTLKPEHLMTKMPDGLLVSWSTCGVCYNHMSHCSCPGGITCSRAIEYIYDKTVAEMAGEDWDYSHKNYLGSMLKNKPRDSKRLDWVVSTSPVEATDPLPGRVTQTDAPKRLRRAAEPPTEPSGGRRLRKATQTPASTVMKGNRLDHAAADKAAASHADDLTQQVHQMLGPKRLRKRGA